MSQIEPQDVVAAAVSEEVQITEPTVSTATPSSEERKGKDKNKLITKSSPKDQNPVVPEPQQSAAPAEKSKAVLFMEDYIGRYLSINDGIIDNELKRKNILDMFRRICFHAVENAKEKQVLDLVYDFFKNNRGKILSEEIALQGIDKLPTSEQMKLSVFYRLFYSATDPNKHPKRSVPNFDVVRDVFNNDHIVNYFSGKF